MPAILTFECRFASVDFACLMHLMCDALALDGTGWQFGNGAQMMKCAGFVATLSMLAVRTAKFPATTARQVLGVRIIVIVIKLYRTACGCAVHIFELIKRFAKSLFLLHLDTVWSKCEHAFHMHCIVKWLQAQNVRQQCPMCRRDWEYRA